MSHDEMGGDYLLTGVTQVEGRFPTLSTHTHHQQTDTNNWFGSFWVPEVLIQGKGWDAGYTNGREKGRKNLSVTLMASRTGQ